MLKITLADYYAADTKPGNYFRCYHLYIITGFDCPIYVGSTSKRCSTNGLIDRLRAKLVKTRTMPQPDRGDYFVRHLINQIPDNDYETLNKFTITVLQPDEIEGILSGDTSVFCDKPRSRKFTINEILTAENRLIEELGAIFNIWPRSSKHSPIPDEIHTMMGDHLPKHLR